MTPAGRRFSHESAPGDPGRIGRPAWMSVMATLRIQEIKDRLAAPAPLPPPAPGARPTGQPERCAPGAPPLEWMLEYELGRALRHGRDVSLLLIAAPAGAEALSALEGLVRRSDQLFALPAGIALLMTETAKAGALRAVARFREACLEQFDLRFAVASFPGDGRLTQTLLQVARRRLALACARTPQGAVCAD